jgi:arginine/lysine/ornithine decarboxylase
VTDLSATEHEVPPAPYADALHRNAAGSWVRLGVPGHQDQVDRHPALASLAGPELLAMDIPMFTEGVDLPLPGSDEPSPLQEAMRLAAEAWGARRTWFLTHGASQGNHVASLALRSLGPTAVVQRSVHTSVIDGAILAGLRLEFVQPTVDPHLGIAHGVTASALEEQLAAYPEAVAAYLVTPSYFGAVADVPALVEVAHRHGVPLVVDEAWGSHFGFHPELPPSAVQLGADLVISSTHKLGGSLTQSAMLHLGDTAYADAIEPLIVRAMNTVATTSPSALLYASLDLARRDLQLQGIAGIGESIADVERLREVLNAHGRYADPDPSIHAAPDVIALDPLRFVVDTRSGGVPGYVARRLLEEHHHVHVEMATDSCIVGLVGAGSRLDVDYVANALHSLPERDLADHPPIHLPPQGDRAMDLREAYFSPSEVVSAAEAVGRISADSLAAYPPGVANVLPGEIITDTVVDFLRQTAASPYGWVRGSLDPQVSRFRVIAT